MSDEGNLPRKPWYRKTRYIVLIGFIVILLVLSILPSVLPAPPVSKDQSVLNRTVDYFANNYNATTGLIPSAPNGKTFWLYSDNYLASLALLRYDANNQSTVSFAKALDAALEGYYSTLPKYYAQNQYTALNSTTASFLCSQNLTIGWAGASNSSVTLGGSAAISTTANSGANTCATGNYADSLFLQAIFYHHLGNDTQAVQLFKLAQGDFDGKGFVDQSNSAGNYETYKLALYVYTSSCLNQASSDAKLPTIESLLLRQQDNSTGGFYGTYNTSLAHSSNVDTQATAMGSLAVELMINPSSAC